MKRQEFTEWLKENYSSGDRAIKDAVARVSRVEKTYGDLDLKITKKKFEGLIEKEFNYSKSDYDKGLKPLHKILINGNLYEGTASLRTALRQYYQFRFQRDDSYRKFLRFFGIKEKDFFEYGQKSLIFADSEKVYIQTKEILEALDKGTRTVYFRSYGRGGKGTALFDKLYKYLFPNATVVADSSGNTIPKRNIQNLTGRRIGSDSQSGDTYNYVLSHIFGKTKNPIFFEGAFNFCLTPKIYDPFTGNECNLGWNESFSKKLTDRSMKEFKDSISLIKDYIQKNDILNKIDVFIKSNNLTNQEIDDIKKNWNF